MMHNIHIVLPPALFLASQAHQVKDQQLSLSLVSISLSRLACTGGFARQISSSSCMFSHVSQNKASYMICLCRHPACHPWGLTQN